jgi:hypothetical protein
MPLGSGLLALVSLGLSLAVTEFAILLADLPADLRARFLERFPELRFLVFPSKAERPDLYYRKDGHWNPAGHVLAATRTLTAIREAGIAPHCLGPAAEGTP